MCVCVCVCVCILTCLNTNINLYLFIYNKIKVNNSGHYLFKCLISIYMCVLISVNVNKLLTYSTFICLQ